ncbi:MAG: rod shape-determining protein MreC [Wenzhouxiangellaceae bacterium]|nr:rod shape-determining protein MreC [Wenzhouxiangellaceae bacterium]
MNRSSPAQRGALLEAAGGTARLMFYTLLAITLMALDFRGRYVDRFQQLAGSVVEPLFWAVDLPFSGTRELLENFSSREQLHARVDRLEAEGLQAQAGLGRLRDLEAENRQLRALLGASRPADLQFVAAELASIDLDPFAHRVMVKRGQADGIRAGMPVIDAQGVMGQVDQAFHRMSRVILISDPDHALPVQILPNGERTIAYGTGTLDRLRLTDLPMNTPVAVGDQVVTSGLGGRFAPGLPVGQVVSMSRVSGQAFATAEVQTLSAMARNRMVLIVEMLPHPEADPAPLPGSEPEIDETEPGPPPSETAQLAGEDDP